MTSKLVKTTESETERGIFFNVFEQLADGAGDFYLTKIVLCLPAQDIANFIKTSFIKQLSEAYPDDNGLCCMKKAFDAMKRLYTIYMTLKQLPRPSRGTFKLESMRRNYRVYLESMRNSEYLLLKRFPLVVACMEAKKEDVYVLVTEHDEYVANVQELLQLEDVHNLVDMVNVIETGKDEKSACMKNALHECIFSYNEERNVESCQKRLAIFNMLMNKCGDARLKLPDTPLYTLPFLHTGGQLKKWDDALGVWIRWIPFSCVLSTNDFPDYHVISPNMLEDSMYIPNNHSQQSFMLIYFHCYHWGMDWFYQRELYEYGLLNGEDDEKRVNCHIEDGVYINDDLMTDEEFDGYLQKKKEITAAFGKRVFDGAKSIGIINDIFGYHDGHDMYHDGHVSYGHGERPHGATILDLHEIAFRKLREKIGVGDYVCLEPLKTSYDKAVEAKIKQLREEYGAKRYSELKKI